MRKEKRITRLMMNPKGVTLIELLVALVIFAMLIGGVYRLFVAQSRAYTVQDHVVETQQTIRSSMEVMLRDLRMAGFDSDNTGSQITIVTPITPGADDLTVDYEYDNLTRYSVRYWRDANSKELRRQLTTFDPLGAGVASPVDVLLENVEDLHFTYGVDTNADDLLDGWVEANGVNPGDKVVAVRVRLTSRPQQVIQEAQQMMSPRTLESAVTLRNQCLR